MIAYKLIGNNGRLGNQLFQIASTIGIAMDNKQNYYFNDAEIFKFFPKLQNNIKSDFYNFTHIYNEQDFCYQEIRFLENTNTTLFGYFQSFKYFYNNWSFISHLLEIENPRFLNYTNQFQNIKTCSIHVRRGDYITANQLNPLEPHPLIKIDYYYEAINYINADKYIIFSDDIPWCKEKFKGDKFYFFDNGEQYKNNMEYDLFELQVMASLNHNIIANSSYSWWAAFLNQNKNKIVIAPKIWFGHNYAKTICKYNYETMLSSLIPKQWIII